MNDYSKQYLQYTIKLWQPFYEKPLTSEDALEICDNMTEIYEYLNELSNKYGKEK